MRSTNRMIAVSTRHDCQEQSGEQRQNGGGPHSCSSDGRAIRAIAGRHRRTRRPVPTTRVAGVRMRELRRRGSRSRARRRSSPAASLGASSRHFDTIDPPDLDLEAEALRARRALVEVPGDGSALPHRQLTVEVFVDAEDRVVAVHLAVQPPVAESTRGRRLLRSAYSHNRFCSCFLPRWMRLITVPIGTSRISAISL